MDLTSAPHPVHDEILLHAGRYHARVSSLGASLRQLWKDTPAGPEDLIWGYEGTAQKKGGQGDVLIPFPGRIAQGEYRFQGQRYQLEKNDKEGPNAIHGFVRQRSWNARSSDAGASFRLRLSADELRAKGYPFTLEIAVGYLLRDRPGPQGEPEGLTCDFSIQNLGSEPAPVGAGFHPYFTVGLPRIDEASARIPARSCLEFNDQLLPTGRVLPVAGTELDFRQGKTVGSLHLNHCFTDLDLDARGRAQLCLRDPEARRQVHVWMDGSFKYLVAYTGDALGANARKALALEPMTCATDAFNHPEWGLTTLAPGQVLEGSWGVYS